MENSGIPANNGGRMTMMEGDVDQYERDRNRHIVQARAQFRSRTFSNGSTRNAFGAKPLLSTNQGVDTPNSPPITSPNKRSQTLDTLQYSSEDVLLMSNIDNQNENENLYGSGIMTEPPSSLMVSKGSGYGTLPTAVEGQPLTHVETQQPKEESWWKIQVRNCFYDTEQPEFTSLQQFCWAIVIGVLMGIFTAYWGKLIEACVEFVWKDVPEFLYENGIFTDLNGGLPLPHYMWICPTILGGVRNLCHTIYNFVPKRAERI